MTEYAFANFDLCRLYAHVFDWNAASARVLEKAGYEFEGRLKKSVTKDGQTIDQLMYAMIRKKSSHKRHRNTKGTTKETGMKIIAAGF